MKALMKYPDWKFWKVEPRNIIVSYMMFFETEVGRELGIDGELYTVIDKNLEQKGEHASYVLVVQESMKHMRVPGRPV